jgi:hypothetical protein
MFVEYVVQLAQYVVDCHPWNTAVKRLCIETEIVGNIGQHQSVHQGADL